MKHPFIVSACRTPIGRFLGALKDVSAVSLGAHVVREAVCRAGIPSEAVDEVIMGNVLSAGLGQNPARQTAIGAGIPPEASALTINQVCGSGLKSVMLAVQGIQVGDVNVVVAGGMENMSRAPYLMMSAREGFRLGDAKVVDSMIHDGLWDPYDNYHMGCTGEAIARRFEISREAQDEYAVGSHCKAVDTAAKGLFRDEIRPVEIPQRRGGTVVFCSDEGPRQDASVQALGRLKPVFDKNGTVTAGNASQISDGAAAVTVLSEKTAEKLGSTPMARVVAAATSGIEPAMVMMAPVGAIRKVLKRAGWTDSQVDLFEINEAFSVQSLALTREIPLDPDRLNVHGGGVALGHPLGASGARILTTLLYALKARNGKKGVASLCLGGGNAVALAVEMVC